MNSSLFCRRHAFSKLLYYIAKQNTSCGSKLARDSAVPLFFSMRMLNGLNAKRRTHTLLKDGGGITAWQQKGKVEEVNEH